MLRATHVILVVSRFMYTYWHMLNSKIVGRMTSLHYTLLTGTLLSFMVSSIAQAADKKLWWTAISNECFFIHHVGLSENKQNITSLVPRLPCFPYVLYTFLRIIIMFADQNFCGSALYKHFTKLFSWFDVGKVTPTSGHTERWRDGKQLWLMVYKGICDATVGEVHTPLQQTAWEWPWVREAPCHFWLSPNTLLISALVETPLQRTMVLSLSMLLKQW